MSTVEVVGRHYFQQHGLRAQPPEALNSALKEAIGRLEANLYGSARSELTAAEVAMLERAGVDVDQGPGEADPVLQYATDFAAILATSLTPAAVARLLGLTPVRVRQLVRQRTLYAIRVDGRWHVPIFQFDGNALIPNIGQVTERLAELDPVSVMRWYTTADPELEDNSGNLMTPLEWLKSGRSAQALIKIVPDA